MSKLPSNNKSLSEINGSVDVNQKKNKFKRFLAFLGPAYLVSVGYMDPGNWATDLAGGSQYGYTLIWVLLMSNMMALLLQSLSARLGIVRGRDLAQANREYYPKGLNLVLYFLAEIAIAATDLAEILGMAIGIQLLTGIPLVWAVCLTALDTFLILFLQKLGIRKLEAFIIGLIFIIGLSFLVEIILAKPDLKEVAQGFIPTIPDFTALYIAIGIIGATVMPHNLYLHSSLVQSRKITKDTPGIKKALKFNFWDSFIALNLAFFVNAGILILAATVFYKSGMQVSQLSDAYKLLDDTIGNKWAPTLFAIALIAAGQSSTVTGTLAGQIVMEGYLHLRINPMIRRLITRLVAIIPAIIVILVYGEKEVNNLLIFSQVILSFQLAFAIIPLIHFVSDKKTMGSFAITPLVKILSWFVTIFIIILNVQMLYDSSANYLETGNNFLIKMLIVACGLGFVALLAFIILYKPKEKTAATSYLHRQDNELILPNIQSYKRIAVALEFSNSDSLLISNAISQGEKKAVLLLIHIIESPTTQVLEEEAHDFETQNDIEKLKSYQRQLLEENTQAEFYVGYKNRAKEIVKIAKESKADLLIMGAHRHKATEDLIYGETINSVRHNIDIPLLIVQL